MKKSGKINKNKISSAGLNLDHLMHQGVQN